MADQIKELIEKIQAEGIQAAQDKANEIENEARQKADWIIQKASAQAKKIVDDARDAASRFEASGHAALQQAGRDIVLALKKEILEMLERLIASQAAEALTPENLASIISGVIGAYASKGEGSIIVYLKEQDRQSLESHFLGKLKNDLKRGIELRGQGNIRAGFIISFDNGKSQFDFTDREIAAHLGSLLKPSIAGLLNGQKT
jgi:V/A-type H+-transporting ATPase subunit E